tara:strand:- start:26 stop:493 length:468 start_codon:yes stop_codon:yes gene_type:complete
VTAECANAELGIVVPLERFGEYLALISTRMEDEVDDDGYEEEYFEIGSFETWFLDILALLIEDATGALVKAHMLMAEKNRLKVLGKVCPPKLNNQVQKALKVSRICFRGIADVIEEPAARILRGMGIAYHGLVQLVHELADQATRHVSLIPELPN